MRSDRITLMNSPGGTVRFHEEQRFGREWLWFILLAGGVPIAVIFGMGLWQQLVRRMSFGNNPMSDGGVLFTFFAALASVGGVAWLFAAARLVTEVRGETLYLRYRPFHRLEIPLSRIRSAAVRKYAPIREFGGWGIRYGFGAGWVWNVSGTMGVQLVLDNGRKVLVGSQRPEALKTALERGDR